MNKVVWGLTLLFLSSDALARGDVKVSSADIKVGKTSTENFERDVDTVALASQEQAISKLSDLLKKYAGKRQEPVLLAKLGELQQQQASILFRIAHGNAHRTKKALDLSRYNKAMRQSISSFNILIGKYPYYEEIHVAYYLRGKAQEEIGAKLLATKDYLHLVKNYPDVDEVLPAYMSLAEFAIQDNDHGRAVGYLRKVEEKPESPHYPFALYKLAWAQYNLKNIPSSLSYAEKHVAYYNAKGQLETSDLALRDNSLTDMTLFYIEGFEQKLPQYALGDALAYFKKQESGPSLGKMLTKFSKLLRSHGHETALVDFKNQVLQSESHRPESLEVVLTTYDFQLNKRRYQMLTESAQDIVRLHEKHSSYEGFARAEKMLLDTADGMQNLIIKNKDATEVANFSPVLASIYDSFVKIVDDSDPRIPRVHYNLAETLFTIKDFTGATEHYRWVVDHGSWNKKDKEKFGTVADSSLKSIASRYEVLRQKQLIPRELSAKSLKDDSDKKLDPLIAEWIDWLDTHISYSQKDTENFAFESSRTLYSQNHIVDAMKRMRKFATKYPNSSYAIPSASLTVDTYIATQDWEETHELAEDFLDVKEWKETPFSKHLFSVAADAFYKQVETLHRANDFKGAIKRADQFLKKYASSTRLADTLMLAGTAALSTNEKARASEYFTRLIKEVPKSDGVGTALLARAQIAEDRHQFTVAASDYKFYLGLPASMVKLKEKEIEALRRKTLALTWLAGDYRELRTALESKALCTEALALECEKYSILALLNDPSKLTDPKTTENAFDLSRKGEKDNRTLWAIVALEGAKNLAWRDRLHMVKQVGSGWEELDPLVRFTMIPIVSASIPRTLQMNRKLLREIAPLKASEKWITHRIDVVREIEAAATRAVKMPWSRIRAEVLNEVAGLYLDISRELSQLNPPKDLPEEEIATYHDTIRKIVMPFEEKGQEIRAKSFEIASRFSIEDDSFASIADPFFAENPSQAKALKPSSKTEEPAAMNLAFLDEIDSSGKWDDVDDGDFRESNDPSLLLKQLWADALKAKRWQQVGFFMQEAQEKSLIQAGSMNLVRAMSLAAVGARGEALNELDDARKEFKDVRAKTQLLVTLVQYALKSCGRDRAKDLVKQIQADELNRKEAGLVETASLYTGLIERKPAAVAPAKAQQKKQTN